MVIKTSLEPTTTNLHALKNEWTWKLYNTLSRIKDSIFALTWFFSCDAVYIATISSTAKLPTLYLRLFWQSDCPVIIFKYNTNASLPHGINDVWYNQIREMLARKDAFQLRHNLFTRRVSSRLFLIAISKIAYIGQHVPPPPQTPNHPTTHHHRHHHTPWKIKAEEWPPFCMMYTKIKYGTHWIRYQINSMVKQFL